MEALCPLVVYAANAADICHYNPINHSISRTVPANANEKLAQAAPNPMP